MFRIVLMALALGGCMSSFVRAPKTIPADGHVDCTDTMEMPVAAVLVAVASAGTLALALTHTEYTYGHGNIWWGVFGGVSGDSLVAAAEGYAAVTDCRDAKRRGARQAEVFRRDQAVAAARASSRAEAGTLWKRAAAAARENDCASVRDLDPRIRDLDVELHALVFARDVAIARGLAAP